MRTFLVLYKKRKYFTKASHPQLEAVKKKFSLDVNISCVMQETKIFHQAPTPHHQCYYIVLSLQKITRFNSMVEDLRKKFSLHANISCVKQKSKLFHQAPPLTLVLLYCKFLTEIHAVQFDSGIFKEEILFRCKNFLCYARNKNFHQGPPSTLVLLYCKFLIENHSV